MFDLVLKDGMVIDGTGQRPPFRADVAVAGQKIAAIGDLAGAAARAVFDIPGMMVSPGFIDTHVHTDAALLNDPQHESGILMGVTTEVLGQDGLSYAPLSPENYRMYSRYMSGLCGVPPQELDMSSITAFRSHYHRTCAVNTVALVPHCAVRLSTVGFNDVPLTGRPLDAAKDLVREGIRQGAAGMSTGLGFFPAAYSTTKELVELAKVVAEMDGVFVIQYRFFNSDRAEGLAPVAEALEIARRSGVKLHIAHYRTTPANPGGTAAMMEELDRAVDDGVDLTLDAYPYPCGSTMPVCRLPGWFVEGGTDAILTRLRDPDDRRRVVEFLEETNGPAMGHTLWSYIGSARNKNLEGMAWSDVAEQRSTSVADMMCQVMLEEELDCGLAVLPPFSVAVWRQIETDIMRLLDRDDYMVGSDSIPIGSACHPRAYGTFPRLLGRLRRRHGVPLAQLVHRMTGNPAARFGLSGRGVIKENNFADLVVFDPDRIDDLATFEDSRVPPAGIAHVMVNGQLAVQNGRCTGVLAGEAVP
ncbi:MAG: amidohydrolase family protein [Chloroflexi bacterium]|nr:amidohydrolase family protein [Chloroflexota bacterium]